MKATLEIPMCWIEVDGTKIPDMEGMEYELHSQIFDALKEVKQ